MKTTRLATVVMLACSCQPIAEVVVKYPIAYDVADAVAVGAASTVALTAHDGPVQGTAIGVDVIALGFVPLLVVCTALSRWGSR